jgi:hypothetical protein
MPEEKPSPTPAQDPPTAAPESFPVEPAGKDVPATRSKRTFWQKLGGEGLTVSLIIHLALILIAAVWVISTVTDSAKKDPDSFSTGQGGGAAGDKAKQFQTRSQPKNPKSMAKNATRITSKSANATISLPDLPTSSVAWLNTGMMGGGSSKGFGGGAGGGLGSGMGVGRGNGRNFVSVFGSKTALNGLPGTFYDFKQNRAGKPTPMMGGAPEKFGDPSNNAAVDLYILEVNKFLHKGFAVSSLSNVFRAPDTLLASQIFIPPCPATEAPKAFGVDKECKPSRWIVHYRGTVKAPQTGKFRFVGSGDDFLAVRWNRKVALDSGYGQYLTGAENIYKDFGNKKCDETHPSQLGKPMRAGPWISIIKDTEVPLEVVIGETPGGFFYAILCIEVMAADGKGEGTLKLFRLTSDELPEAIKNGHPSVPNVDMVAEGWIFKAGRSIVIR